MQTDCTYLPYSSTGYFSTIVSDYIGGDKVLQPFYDWPANISGAKAAISKRKQFATGRKLLTDALRQQYSNTQLAGRQQQNIEALSNENTFTVCTAHQPNIFTGPLYFIYKIIHAIKLAEVLSAEIKDALFVPVYYMGSEDADLEELNHIYIDGVKYEWKTNQKGAVGRMKVDKALLQLIDAFSGQLLVHEHGNEVVELMKRCYVPGSTIEQATFKLVNELFAGYGLLVLLPDNRLLKKAFAPVIEKELLHQFSHKEVAATVSAFPSKYKVQAAGRQLNLFYLKDDMRERIEFVNGEWVIVNTDLKFSQKEILEELCQYPERFSPNVILRPVFQETILPNIAFIGGGGEIAYWLELKKVFETAGVPYPMLVVRNSFLLVDERGNQLQGKLNLSTEDLFKTEADVMNAIVKKESSNQLGLEKQKQLLAELYNQLKSVAGNVDATLQPHTEALHKKALGKIEALEKKILKAEKKKFEAQHRQLRKLKQRLFPNNNLQERVENFMLYYAKEGKSFLQAIAENSLPLEQEFAIIGIF